MSVSQVGGKTFLVDDLIETPVQAVTGSFLVFNLTCFNADATNVVYVQFFDALEADVVLGTTVPDYVAPMPPIGGIDGGLSLPKRFRTGVVIAASDTATGAGAPSTAALVEFDFISG